MFPSEKIIDFIRILLKNYEKNVKNISDIIDILRNIIRIDEGENPWFDDIFLGLGIFLENLKENDLHSFLNINFRNVFYYAQKIDNVNENDLILKNNFARISLMKTKSILACSVLCILRGSSNNINLQALYTGISLGYAKSNYHVQMLRYILNFFSEDPANLGEYDQNSFIAVKVVLRDPSNLSVTEPSYLWPIVLTSKTHIADISLPNCQNIWPIYFSRLLPSNLFNSSNISVEFPVYSKLPFLIPLLPLLTISIIEKICFIDVKWKNFHHRFQSVHFLNSWDKKSQYSKEYVIDNISQCVLTLKSSNDFLNQENKFRESTFATTFTKSVIEDAIEKLHFKTSPIPFPTRSNSYTEPLQQTRTSPSSQSNLPYISRGSREGSLTSNIPIRSTRHSYSTSSSSRTGSLQLSSLSSRRSSSNISSSSNKDEASVALGDKTDYPLHTFQPIIVEESCNHGDEEEGFSTVIKRMEDKSHQLSLIPLTEVMSASICDSSKMSLSNNVEVNTGGFNLRRRNSSPIFKQIFQDDSDDCSLIFEQKELYDRCCEEDANNDHLIRLNNRGRRQSLPCHLKWLYELPLSDMTKLNLSNSRSVIDDGGISFVNIFEELSDDFFDGKIIGDSKDTLAKLIIFADEILNEMCLNGRKDCQQQLLKMDLLEKRRFFEELSFDDEVIWPGDDHSLHSRDLATFDKVLNSSTFFDNEALNIFSKISTMSSSSSTWTPHAHICYGVVDIVNDQVCHQHCQSQCKEKSIVDYVDQLTTSIMTDVMDHDFGASKIYTAYGRSILNLAERISMEIITDSMTHLCYEKKKSFDNLSLIYMRPFPVEYDRQLSTLIQMIAAAIAQQESGRTHMLVFNQVTAEMEEIFNLLAQEKVRCSVEKVFRALINIVHETGTVSISNLILYLMHNY